MPFANLNIGCPRSLAFGDRGDDLIVLLCVPHSKARCWVPRPSHLGTGETKPLASQFPSPTAVARS